MYIFYREDRDPRLVYLFASYEQTANTTTIEWNGKTVCALFLNKASAKMVALQQGWKDITEEYTNRGKSDEDKAPGIESEDKKTKGTKVVEKTIKTKPKKRTTRKAKK